MADQKQILFSLLFISVLFVGMAESKNTLKSGQHYLKTLSCESDKSGIEGYTGIKSCVLGR